MYSLLVRMYGHLCLAEVKEPELLSDGKPGHGSCPACGGSQFTNRSGWIWCANGCDFAYCEGAYDRVLAEMKHNRKNRNRDHGRP